jgi:hypothetical protein
VLRALAFGVIGCLGFGLWSALSNGSSTSPPIVDDPPRPDDAVPAIPNAGLVMVESDLIVGDVWERDSMQLTLTVHNPTDSDVTISRWRPMCGGGIWPHNVTIAAGEAVEFSAWILLTPRSPRSPETVLNLGQTFRPEIEGRSGAHPGWSVSGRSLRAFMFPDHYMEWERPKAEGAVTRRIHFPVIPLRPLTGFSADCDDECAQVQVAGPDLRGHYHVTVTADAAHLASQAQCRVQLSAEIRGGGESVVTATIWER